MCFSLSVLDCLLPTSWYLVLITESFIFTNADVPGKAISSYGLHHMISLEKLEREHIYVKGERKEVKEEEKRVRKVGRVGEEES